jgi:transcription elongation factor Elf1
LRASVRFGATTEAAPRGRINRMKMAGADAVVIRFQCPKCGCELEQTIASLKLHDHMSCKGCGIGINIDTNRLANAADEIQSAIDKVPPEITIKFFR